MEFLEYKSNNVDKIKNLFIKTFSDSESESEGILIGNLVSDLITKTDEKDRYIYIAKENEKIIGCIIFSRLKFEKSKIKAFLLAPVAILTDYQGQGIGQKLINFGHESLKKQEVEIVITYGDINFYSKVGYKKISEKIIKAPLKLSQPEGWLAQSFISDEIKAIPGNSYCVDALNNPKYW